MNSKQVLILKCAVFVAVLMLVFPPLVSQEWNGFTRNRGYGFLLSDNNGALINIGLLFAQWVLIGAVTAAIFYVSKQEAVEHSEPKTPIFQKIKNSMNEGWGRSKFWRNIFTGMIVIDVFIALLQKDGTNAGIRAVGWVLLLMIHYIYHFVRAFFGIQQRTQTSFGSSLKRISITVAIITIATISLFLLGKKTDITWERSLNNNEKSTPNYIYIEPEQKP